MSKIEVYMRNEDGCARAIYVDPKTGERVNPRTLELTGVMAKRSSQGLLTDGKGREYLFVSDFLPEEPFS